MMIGIPKHPRGSREISMEMSPSVLDPFIAKETSGDVSDNSVGVESQLGATISAKSPLLQPQGGQPQLHEAPTALELDDTVDI